MKSVNICVCAHVYTPSACRYPQRPEEVVRPPRSGVRDSCESPDMGAEDWAPVLWKSRKYSCLLKQLLSSRLDFLKKSFENLPMNQMPCPFYIHVKWMHVYFLKSLHLGCSFLSRRLLLVAHTVVSPILENTQYLVGSFLALSLGGVSPGIQCSFLPACVRPGF